MLSNHWRWALLCNVSFATLLVAWAPAFAQSAPVAREEVAPTEEVVVTARKREESIQDVPISLQVFGEDQIEQLNLTSFEDYVRFVPSLSFVSQGPGRSKVVFRGVAESTGSSFLAVQSSSALYLDEQPISVEANSPDPRLIDIERIEVLPGPQASLYGASSQSGTVRIITNKPDPTRIEGYLEGTGRTLFGSGEESWDFNGALNLPIIRDRVALRVSGFAARDGGFIDNVLGATLGGTRDNASLVENDLNSATNFGGRAALRFLINDDWRVTAAYLLQDVNVDGRSDFDPTIGDLQVVRFFNEFFDDQLEQGSLTVEGDAGFADLVFASAYYNRRTQQVDDNTAYNQYLTQASAYFPLYNFGPDPTGFNDVTSTDERITLEARLNSGDRFRRVQWLLGAFYERSDNGFITNSNVVNFPDTPGFQAAQAALPSLAPTDVYFFQTGQYEREQFALFGELTYNVTQRLSLTFGGRWFTADSAGVLRTQLPFGANETIFDANGFPLITVEASPLIETQSDFLPKGNITWKVTDDHLVYATFSQGFRLGGANRDRIGLAVPTQFDPDKLNNYELGWKTSWFDGRLTFNGAGFFMRWNDFQSSIRNPDPNTFFFVVTNAGDAEILGVEAEISARPTRGLELGGAFTVLDAELAQPSGLLSGDPDAPLAAGSRLPVTPDFKVSVYGEYRTPLPFWGAEAFLRADVSHTGDSFNSIDQTIADRQAAYQIANFQVGLESEDWTATLFLNNAFDERAQLFVNPLFSPSITPNRPRELGLTVRRRF